MRVTSRDKTLDKSKAQRTADFIASIKADLPKEKHASFNWLVEVLNAHPRMIEALIRLLENDEEKSVDEFKEDVLFAANVLKEVLEKTKC